MLKILILSHGFYPDVGGIETNSEILAEAFQDFGAEVHIVTWTKDANKKKFSFPVIRNPGIKKLLKEHRRADVILENNPCLRLSWPNIFIHKPLVIALNTWVTRVSGAKGIRDKLKHLWFRRAKKIIAVSDAIRRKEWPDAVVIENPYNNRLFKKLPGINRQIKFVFLGRLVSDKGADQAIRAVSVLINEKILNPNVIQLTIIGDGPEKNKLYLLLKKSGIENAVQLKGVLKGEALVDCLNQHQFILVPSSWEEPYGNVVLEAMACGCIPVASNGGGLPEAVGEAGFLFKRNNVDDMVNVLKNILSDSNKTGLIKAKADCHLKQHTIELVAEKYFKILQTAVS
jgi:glycosyltransferase involved in cell wall biosynthesis